MLQSFPYLDSSKTQKMLRDLNQISAQDHTALWLQIKTLQTFLKYVYMKQILISCSYTFFRLRMSCLMMKRLVIFSDRPNFRFGRTSAELSDKQQVLQFLTKNRAEPNFRPNFRLIPNLFYRQEIVLFCKVFKSGILWQL